MKESKVMRFLAYHCFVERELETIKMTKMWLLSNNQVAVFAIIGSS